MHIQASSRSSLSILFPVSVGLIRFIAPSIQSLVISIVVFFLFCFKFRVN